jgi:UDP-N-acetylmuramoyl-tripeptide--D-alanyl-D-alanine ligase
LNPMSLGSLSDLLGGRLVEADPDAAVSGFATDHREVGRGDLFLAIRGSRVDGHDFADRAVASGAVAVLAERSVVGPRIEVDDLVSALARMACAFRDRFVGPVVGITGSAGKTSTKEFVAAALSPLGRILKSEGNRNTQYTSPLVWSELEADHRAVVVELAMRGFGQIAHLASFSRPTIGIVTNIGYSHLEQVGSREGIARAKGELLEVLPETGVAIVWHEDEFFEILKTKPRCRLRTFGWSDTADCRLNAYRPLSWSESEVCGVLDGEHWVARLPSVGRHVALNAAAAVLAARETGVGAADAARAMGSAQLPPMRMEIRRLGGATIVLDTYNASLPGMLGAIEALGELPCSGRRLAVIGEMRELGDFAEEAHREVGASLARHGVDEVVFFGEPTEEARREYDRKGRGSASRAVEITEVTRFLEGARDGDVVLVKGSRALQLERALDPLPTEEDSTGGAS